MQYTIDRSAMSRILAVINGKGGVGKTSLATHLAGIVGLRGERVLIVDLDAQGNTGHDLGYAALGLSDHGVGLSRAMQFGDPPYIIRNVRPGVDVIPSGPALDELSAVLVSRNVGDPTGAALSLGRVLEPIAGEYALTVLDLPPREVLVQKAALAAAAYVLIPTKTDQASLDGLSAVADRFAEALPLNPDLRLLGVVMFGVTAAAKKVRESAREWIEKALDQQAPVFKNTIRHVEAPATWIRRLGRLAYELELPDEPGVTAAMIKSVAGLAGDYEKVAVEVLTRLVALEQEGANRG